MQLGFTAVTAEYLALPPSRRPPRRWTQLLPLEQMGVDATVQDAARAYVAVELGKVKVPQGDIGITPLAARLEWIARG